LNAYRDRYRKFKRESDRASSLDEMMDNGSLSRRLSPELPTPTIGNDGFENLRRKELRGDIIKLLDRIPKKSSNILVMHLIKEMPYKEIAKKLKCPIGTVMSRMFYARKEAKEAYNYI
jgi:RNA polymerase sigma-70 factor (ECF subfamily)